MRFFKTADGHVHGGRLAGVFYAAGLLPGCVLDHDRKCFVRLVFIVGWWLSFSDQWPVNTLADLTGSVRRFVGLILLIAGLCAGFYFLALLTLDPAAMAPDARTG